MLTGLAILLPLTVLLQFLAGGELWIYITGIIVLVILTLIVYPFRRITVSYVTSHLDINYPSLEESSSLLLQSVAEPGILQQLQIQRTSLALENLKPANPYLRRILYATAALLLSILVTLLIRDMAGRKRINSTAQQNIEKILPAGISSIKLTIISPAYQQQAPHVSASPDFEAPENAMVTWEIRTDKPVKQVTLRFNDSLTEILKPVDEQHTRWLFTKKITTPGFYQLGLDNAWSSFYKMEIRRDQLPEIIVHSPRPATVIDYGYPKRIQLNASVSDDYGIAGIRIMTTIASGSGENVNFRQDTINITGLAQKQTSYILKKELDLAVMKMKPGDELYFYVSATDHYRQEKKSDVFIVTIADTARLMELDLSLSGSQVKPEFFRSQRQIIIETEQLLRDKDSLSLQVYQTKSAALGIDQKLLRLRYGKFLGEENEFHDDEDDHETHQPPPTGDQQAAQFNDLAKLMEPYTHRHDIAEDATFFSPDIKAQLKATLAEMWNAELKLRTWLPQQALVYEYKALRLLKELQQKSRVYVAKTSVKTTPLKPEKRLTGDLSAIQEPLRNREIYAEEDVNMPLAEALSILDKLQTTGTDYSAADYAKIQQVSRRISERAAHEPALFLDGMQASQALLTAMKNKAPLNNQDITMVERTVIRMLKTPQQAPVKLPGRSNELSDEYYRNLQKRNNG
ncbi:hypothetical protein SAMN04488132_111105 [Sediminibacterium ginsengisoli]|uniref:DUF4175 family protein n=2 Tax=Sediminibacterium ginsengisoli TaxID=413434 RepID=A0A1T4RCL0_9BACT|nr:hypothetical protein SAMN04488132_111105 [Sediminibacterium ginsengisoli]